MKIDIVGKRYRYFLIAIIILAVGIISLSSFGRLKAGIDFSSGSLLGITFADQNVAQPSVEQTVSGLGYTAIIQKAGDQFLIRVTSAGKAINTEQKAEIETALADKFGKLSETQFNSVEPLVAAETASNAGIAVLVASAGILLYITWAFRKMPRPFHYGVCAIISLSHDLLASVGVFSILAAILHWEINLMFITGILAVIGYSINNTVIIYDRIRENVKLGVSPDFALIVNNSVVETLGRSLNTNITTLITLLALMFFVGASIQNFVVVLTLGCVFGLFSSIFIGPALLVVWDKHEWGRFLSWIPGRSKA